METNNSEKKVSIFRELVQPFIDLGKTSRPLLGLNISYVIEGLTYFGIVGLLALFFNEYIQLNDIDAGRMVGFQTAGITIAMLFLGATVDWIGLRKSLLISIVFLFFGRMLLTVSPGFGEAGLWGGPHMISFVGIMGIIIGYGIYQPAAYAGVKMLTNSKTSAMGYAMLYALMNLGGFLPGLISPPVRKHFNTIEVGGKPFGINAVFWLYTILTIIGFAVIAIFITKKALAEAIARAQAEEPNKEILEEEEEEEEKQKLSAVEKLKFYLKNFPITDARFM
ncbi:MAG TPA: MFS transporter, partial [bacterium]|nr:MFS transporter [bacterium]